MTGDFHPAHGPRSQLASCNPNRATSELSRTAHPNVLERVSKESCKITCFNGGSSGTQRSRGSPKLCRLITSNVEIPVFDGPTIYMQSWKSMRRGCSMSATAPLTGHRCISPEIILATLYMMDRTPIPYALRKSQRCMGVACKGCVECSWVYPGIHSRRKRDLVLGSAGLAA
jgi:hypothetical protein